MAVRNYSLAKELKIDSRELVDICKRAGIAGKGSAMASLTDDEVVGLKEFISLGGKRFAPEQEAALKRQAELAEAALKKQEAWLKEHEAALKKQAEVAQARDELLRLRESIRGSGRSASESVRPCALGYMLDVVDVRVIYDTSYLMLREFASLRATIESVEKLKDDTFFTFLVEEFVPVQVANEIQRHFADSEKEKDAKQARKRVASLVEHGAAEPDLPRVAQRPASTPALGADSETDRMLIQFALESAKGGSRIAIIATDDGGILYDVVKLRQTGALVHCHTKERQIELQEFLYGVIAQRRSE